MGAWTAFYQRGDVALPGTVKARALTAIKRELAYNGFNDPKMTLSFPGLGSAADKNIKGFQANAGVFVDGVIGPVTARALFFRRARLVQELYHIPEDLICKLKTLESANDPGATGWVDPRDRGLFQINSFFHPEITDAQAFDPKFATTWAALTLVNSYSSTHDWDGALAAHNLGLFYAKKWVEDGKPASGGVMLTVGDHKEDAYVRATEYVRLVKSQTC